MKVVTTHHTPNLRKPVAIIAFGGWNDACDVASATARYVIESHATTDVFADIGPDGLYDFQQHRPNIAIQNGVVNSLLWPTITFTSIERPDDDRDLVVVSGPEPNFHWKTVATAIAETLADLGVEDVLLAGAYVGAVSHRDPVRLSGVASDAVTVVRSGLDSASYEGPTGIVGVVQTACTSIGLRALSMWAPTPPYLGGNPYPKAVLAMVEKISDITNLHLDTSELIAMEADYTQKVDAALEEAGSDVSEFLDELNSYDEPFLGRLLDPGGKDGDSQVASNLDLTDSDELVDEIVKFLEGNG